VKVTVRLTKNFKAEAKPLLKKYHSLSKDLLKLEEELNQNPRSGVSLGHDAYKIRLKIASKGKGKSGGARVITLVETILIGVVEAMLNEETTVNLISIYDKADVDSITDKELRELIKAFREE
jgi:mRNA-degrading endonuclease RelE of RelBE toxin-antitoxin system